MIYQEHVNLGFAPSQSIEPGCECQEVLSHREKFASASVGGSCQSFAISKCVNHFQKAPTLGKPRLILFSNCVLARFGAQAPGSFLLLLSNNDFIGI